MPTEPSLGEFLPLSRFSPPAAPGERSTKGRLLQLRRFVSDLLPAKPGPEGPAELDAIEGRLLAELTPAVDPAAGARALAAALGDWADDPQARHDPRVVVGPPGSELAAVVAELARERGWRAIEPPPRSALIAGGEGAAAGHREPPGDAETPLVVCQLERWLWRTETGLPRVRQLLERLRSQPAPVLVACGSWSWAFLRHAVGIQGLLGEPLVPAPLDDRGLERWLGAPLRARGLECRQAKNRELVFAGDGPPPADGEVAVSPLLGALAAASRGIPGVALALWRGGLRSHDEAEESGEVELDPERTYWARGVEEMEVQPSSRLEPLDRFVLQALLLHGGLPAEALDAVLPFAHAEIQGSARQLAAAGALAEEEGELRVALAAYGPVRKLLAAEGLMVDDL